MCSRSSGWAELQQEGQVEIQKICTSSDSLRTKSRKFQPCSKVEFPALAPSQVHSQKVLLLFLLFLQELAHAVLQKAFVFWIKSELLVRNGKSCIIIVNSHWWDYFWLWGCHALHAERGTEGCQISLAGLEEWVGMSTWTGGLTVPRCRAWLRNSRKHKEKTVWVTTRWKM